MSEQTQKTVAIESLELYSLRMRKKEPRPRGADILPMSKDYIYELVGKDGTVVDIGDTINRIQIDIDPKRIVEAVITFSGV